MPTTDDDVRIAAGEFAKGMVTFWQDRLGAELLGVYLLGSLAHGGFNRRYSDIDMGVISEHGLSEELRDDMCTEAARICPELAPKLSLFWTDRGFSVGRFPPLDRADYLDHAVTLVERERVEPSRPSLEEVRDYLRGRPFANWAERAQRFATLETLEAVDHKPYLRAHLYPARYIYSWMTGEMVSNDVAVAFVAEHPPAGFDVDVVAQALQCRLEAADPDGLFPARSVLPGQVEACARLISA